MGMLKFLKKDTDRNPKIAVFTRMAYGQKIEEEKLAIYREIFLESLKKQIYKDFDVYVITGGVWEQESTPGNIKLITEQDAGGLNISYKHLNEIPKQEYNIQIRVDCDDYLFPGFVLRCLDIYKNTNRNCFIITFRPYKYDCIDKKFYKIRLGKWSNKPSMFTALCQKRDVKHFIYDYRHTRLNRITRRIIFVDEGHCALTIHGRNRLSKIKDTDRHLCSGKI